MRLLSGDRRPLGDAIDVDFTGLGAQIRRVTTVAPSRALQVAGARHAGALRRLEPDAGARDRGAWRATPTACSR